MERYNLDNFKKQKFKNRLKNMARRGISLVLALVMVLPVGVFAAEDNSVWYDAYKQELKTEIMKQNEKLENLYDIPYKGSQTDSRYFAETKAKELFNEVMKEIPVKNGELNISEKSIFAVWEGETLKSIRHKISYYNTTTELKNADNMLEEKFWNIVREKETDIERVEAALMYVSDLKEDSEVIKTIYKVKGEAPPRVYAILFSMMMDKLGYKNSVDATNKDIPLNLVTFKGKDEVYKINVIAGTIDDREVEKDPIGPDDAIKEQIEREIELVIDEIKNSKSLGELKNIIKEIENGITANKLKEIKDKILEIEKEIARYKDKRDVLKNNAEKAGLETNGELKTKFNELQDKIDGKGGTDETDGLETKLNRKKESIAEQAVTNAEENKTVANIAIAKEAVGILDDKDTNKAGLIIRIEKIEKTIADQNAVEEATKAVTDAEAALTKYLNGQIDFKAMQKAIDDADEKIKVVADDTTKGDLKTRLEAVEEKKKAIEEVIKAVDAIELMLIDGNNLIDKEIDKIKEIADYKIAVEQGRKNNFIGKALTTRITEIDKVLAAIEVVNGMEKEADIKTARSAVSKINNKFSKIKNALNEKINDKESAIKDGEPERLIKVAGEAIQAAYDSLIDVKVPSAKVTEAIKVAKTAIGKVKDPLEKIKMDRAIKGIEDTQKAKDAVALVEVTELRKDYNNADKLVTAISDRLEFDGYIKDKAGKDGNFIDIKKVLRSKLNELDPKIGQTEDEKSAKDAVTKVENSLTQKDYDAAKLAIDKPFVAQKVKDELNGRLAVVYTVIDATNAVIAAEKNPGDEKIFNEANDKIKNIDEKDPDKKYERYLANKTILEKRMEIVTNSKNAIDAVINAEKIQKNGEGDLNTAIKEAEDFLKEVTDAKVKKDLEARIKAIKDKQNVNDAYKVADKEVKIIEGSLNGILIKKLPDDGTTNDNPDFDPIKKLEDDIASADALIKLVKDTTKSNELKKRLTDIINAKDVAKLIVKAERSNPYIKAEVAAAEKAVSKVSEDVTATVNYKLIKDNFVARIKYLNIEITKKADYDNAKKLVEKASASLREADIINAIDAVYKLSHPPHKNEWNKKIDEIIDKQLKKKAEDDIIAAITSVELNDKALSQNVSEAKKSVDLLDKVMKQANVKLVEIPTDPPVGYEKKYQETIEMLKNNNIAIDKAIDVNKLIQQADKTKNKDDLKKAESALGELNEAITIAKVGNEYAGKYAKILGNLEKKITDINKYQENEEQNQSEAKEAIETAKNSLLNENGKRENLSEAISYAQVKINNVKDKVVQKDLQNELNKIKVGRDAIVAVNRAKENTTAANVKAAVAAVKKIDVDYGKLIVELEKEISELEKILKKLEEAGKAAKLVEIAETTKKQNDLDKARMAVDLLIGKEGDPDWDDNPKKLLGDRLKVVEEYIKGEKLKDTNAISAAETALEKALINITQSNIIKVSPSEEEIKTAYLLLEGKEEIQKGEDGKDTVVVIKDGAEHFLKEAKDQVKKITLDLARKNMLNEIIAQREAQIILAKEKVHIKEGARLVDIAARRVAERAALPENATTEEKQEAELQARKAIEDARIVIGRINSTENIMAKQELQKSINDIDTILGMENADNIVKLAHQAVEEASKSVLAVAEKRENGEASLSKDIENAEFKIRAAKLVIGNIPDVKQKDREQLTEFIENISKMLQNIKDGVSDEEAIAKALEAIEEARKRVEAKDPNAMFYITVARSAVNSIINENKRAELNAILDALVAALDDGTGTIDDGKNPKDSLMAAIKAVEKAEESKLQKDVDAARKLVNKLVDGITKDSLIKRLNAIKVVGINKPGDNTGGNKPGGSTGGKGKEIENDPLPANKRDTSVPDPKWGKEKELKKK